MTHREALAFIYYCPRGAKQFYIEQLGESVFYCLVAMGFLTSNLGAYYWTTRLFNDYYKELV
jgi:hypothetical protein